MNYNCIKYIMKNEINNLYYIKYLVLQKFFLPFNYKYGYCTFLLSIRTSYSNGSDIIFMIMKNLIHINYIYKLFNC